MMDDLNCLVTRHNVVSGINRYVIVQLNRTFVLGG